ncbi:MAG: endolytic transglycosylase MltG [Nitrospirota bacterium]|nr:MAG: endolytic transglycosylase MltG [Nitrospirota bacterium]
MRPEIKVFASLLLVAGLGGMTFQLLNQPIGESSQARIIEIPKGLSFHQIADRLRRENLIAHEWFFSGMARLKGEDRKIIPGEYELHAGMRPTEILSKLVKGRIYYHTVTIPEGYTIEQIANLLAAKELTDRAAFLRLTRDPNLIKSLKLQVPSLEGYLFPDTYFFSRPTSPDAIINTLVRRFWEVFSPALLARTRDLDMTVQEVLTLASVIEKETGLSQERPLVSGVFHNRLRKNIPLQSDPTVIYALKDFDGNIRKEDLLVESPYNTYLVVGLPPGPIANPGEEAIRAALFPTPTDFVYFVSRNDGSHEFSSTLAEHNHAVEKYQRSRKKQAS